jgi:hypothetical protein
MITIAFQLFFRTYHQEDPRKHRGIRIDDDVNLLGEKYRKENTEALLDTSKKAGLEVNAEKTKYIFTSSHQTAG